MWVKQFTLRYKVNHWFNSEVHKINRSMNKLFIYFQIDQNHNDSLLWDKFIVALGFDFWILETAIWFKTSALTLPFPFIDPDWMVLFI